MDRMDELTVLQTQLEQAPQGLEQTLDRAEKRLYRRKRRIYRGLSSMAATFALFVALVNFSMPVAYACSRVPVLRELAEAVTFSRSLTLAVDNDYVQPIALTQTQNGITASVEYLIVDQKQVNVFFRLLSEDYQKLDARPAFLTVEGSRAGGFTSLNDHNVPVGQLQSVTTELTEDNVSNQMRLKLAVYDSDRPGSGENGPVEAPESSLWSEPEKPSYLAEFDFLLTFDPSFTQQGEYYPLDKTIEIAGQKLTFTAMEIYPTHLRLHTQADPDNTADIDGIEYEIRGDWGIVFEPERNGIASYGHASQGSRTYRADSPWFCRSDKLEVVILRATLRDKDMGRVYVDLENGRTEGALPQGVSLLGAEKDQVGWQIHFKAPRIRENHSYQLFGWQYYDADGNEYHMHSIGSGGWLEGEEYETYFSETLMLKEYHQTEVWLEPSYTTIWQAENSLVVTVK